ncbi:MAG: BtpA family membrane complex biogenesis protein, partial [Alphaproteobacteria bacterium]|nr:BtpA family membrane complex biogenesis protein [Alphaproteobacteria bacterium]
MAAPPVLPPKPDALAQLFGVKKPVIGVVHLPALPGAPRYDGMPVRAIY